MFIDASALTAMMTGEDDARDLLRRVGLASVRLTSPLAVWETAVAVTRIIGCSVEDGATAVESFLGRFKIVVASVEPRAGWDALTAFARYGKGRGSPAGLNFGDCFAYACARHFRQPLLCKGDDFIHTDIELA